MRERATALEEGHLVDEVVQEEQVVRAQEVADDAGCGHGGGRLADGGDVVQAEVVELGHVELVELVCAYKGAQLADLNRELLSLPPLILICLFDLVLSLYEQLDVFVTLLLREHLEDLGQVFEHARRYISYILEEVEENRHEIALGDHGAEDASALVHGEGEAAAHFPTHIANHLIVHRLKLLVPVIRANRFENSREIVRAIVCRVVVDLRDLDGATI